MSSALRALARGELRPLDLLEIVAGHDDGATSRRLCASTVALGYVMDVVLYGRQRLAPLGHAHLANFRGFPDASPHDGRFDVMELGHRWPRQLLHNLAVLAGSGACGPGALRQATDEHVELELPRTLMVDGEMLHDVRHITVRCLPAAVRCVVA